MAKSSTLLDWCIVRLGDDHNWWVAEVSDPVRWDVDGLSIIDPRQVAHLIELVDPLRDYGFDQDLLERAFIPFRIDRDLGGSRVRLVRVKDSFFESEEKLFALPDLIDEENGPYADLLDHLTRLRVKMLNELFDFEQKLTVDEVEDEIREEQNNSFIEGQAVHVFTELSAILDYTPAGWEDKEEPVEKPTEPDEHDDLPELDKDEEERLKNDESLKWDEDEEDSAKDEEPGLKKDDDKDEDDEEEADEDEDEDEDEADEDGGQPRSRHRGKR